MRKFVGKYEELQEKRWGRRRLHAGSSVAEPADVSGNDTPLLVDNSSNPLLVDGISNPKMVTAP